jgi:hypothetical protein
MSAAEGLTANLALVSLVVGVLSFLLLRGQVGTLGAALVALVRILIPMIYFSVFFDGSGLEDDITYLLSGMEMLARGYGPLSSVLDENGLTALRVFAGGNHYFYAWWNVTALYLFGPHYYAPVYLNILSSVLSGVVICRMLRRCGYSERYLRLFLIFFVLHWDIVAWSSFRNLKDMMVMLITLYALDRAMELQAAIKIRALAGLAVAMLLLTTVRFYAPVLIALTILAWSFAGDRKLRTLLVVIAPLTGFLLYLGMWQASEAYAPEFELSVAMEAFTRFLLTPRPWSVDEGYWFLQLPSILHWLFIVPCALSIPAVWKASKGGRLPVLHLILILAFYSLQENAAYGPRHRVQVAYVFVFLQFDFIWRNAGRLAPLWRRVPIAPVVAAAPARQVGP